MQANCCMLRSTIIHCGNSYLHGRKLPAHWWNDISFAVYEVASIDNSDVCANYAWFNSAGLVGHFMKWFFLAARSSDTLWTALETVDVSAPSVSPITCKNDPLAYKTAKQLGFASAVTWHDFCWFFCSSRLHSMYLIDSLPNLYLARSCSSVKRCQFNRGLVLIGLWTTQSNHGLNFNPGLVDLILG